MVCDDISILNISTAAKSKPGAHGSSSVAVYLLSNALSRCLNRPVLYTRYGCRSIDRFTPDVTRFTFVGDVIPSILELGIIEQLQVKGRTWWTRQTCHDMWWWVHSHWRTTRGRPHSSHGRHSTTRRHAPWHAPHWRPDKASSGQCWSAWQHGWLAKAGLHRYLHVHRHLLF